MIKAVAGMLLITLGVLSTSVSAAKRHLRECERLFERYLEQNASISVDLTAILPAVEARDSARLLIGTKASPGADEMSRPDLTPLESPTSGLALLPTRNHQGGTYALLSGSAARVTEMARTIQTLNPELSFSGQILQMTGPTNPARYSPGSKSLRISSDSMTDILADLEASDEKSATLFDTDLRSVYFTLPDAEISSLSDKTLERIGVTVAPTFDRRQFSEESLVYRLASFTIFSERAFKRLQQLGAAETGTFPLISAEFSAELDRCLGPLCEPSRKRSAPKKTGPVREPRAALAPPRERLEKKFAYPERADELARPVVPAEVRKRIFDVFARSRPEEFAAKSPSIPDLVSGMIDDVAAAVPFERVREAKLRLHDFPWDSLNVRSLTVDANGSLQVQEALRHAWSSLDLLLDLPPPGPALTLEHVAESIYEYNHHRELVEKSFLRAPTRRSVAVALSAQQSAVATGLMSQTMIMEAMKHWHGIIYPPESFSRGKEWTMLFTRDARATVRPHNQNYLALIEDRKIVAIEFSTTAALEFYRKTYTGFAVKSIGVAMNFPIYHVAKPVIAVEAWKAVQYDVLRGFSPLLLESFLRRVLFERTINQSIIRVKDPLTGLTWDLTLRLIDKSVELDTFLLKNIHLAPDLP